jgi:3-oxoacyl-[acyl-carrier protein] reductase
MVASVEKTLGAIDILVNNAGVIVRPGAWDALKGTDLARTIDVNLKGAIHCIQRVTPGMITRNRGRIINLSTTYAATGPAPVLAYTAAKAGINTVTYGMARELGKHGITVNAVAPGNIDTDMTRAAGESATQWAISTTPLGRLGTPQEVAEAVVFLARAEFITGHILAVDGGQLLNM